MACHITPSNIRISIYQQASITGSVSVHCRANPGPATTNFSSKISIKEFAAYYLHIRSIWSDDNPFVSLPEATLLI